MIFFFQAEDGIRDLIVTGVQTCALPIFPGAGDWPIFVRNRSEQFEARFVMVEIMPSASLFFQGMQGSRMRSEEHTSELQSRSDLVCRLLLEKKKKDIRPAPLSTQL